MNANVPGAILTLAAAAVALGTAVVAASEDRPPLATVPYVDLDRYMGKWYEIAAFPQRFQKGCHCSTAEYEMTDKGYVRVVNACRKDGPQGKLKVAKGKAFVVEGSGSAKLRVQFFWPFRGDYWIIDLAEDYSYAVVGEQSRQYLWILARAPVMDEVLYQEILARVKDMGFDIGRLKRTDQSCHTP
ncbi:MAG: lipocalin family protein [Candidatus Aminicenantes bacterium]|nr:lipocalin family protein [Candidatus Aminicenantes bacterium]